MTALSGALWLLCSLASALNGAATNALPSQAAPPLTHDTASADVVLSNALATVESYRAASRFNEAAEALGALLASDDADTCAALATLRTPRTGLWRLVLERDRLQYLRRTRKAPTDAYLRDCDLVLASSRAAAAGQRWQSYGNILLMRALHFKDIGDTQSYLTALREAVNYDVANEACLFQYLQALLSCNGTRLDGAQADDVRRLIATYRAETKMLTPRMAIINVYINAGSQSNAFAEALAIVTGGALAQPEELRTLVDMLRALMNGEDPAQVRAYYKALTALAIKQPPTPNGAKMVAYLLSEQRKLEMLMPDLKAGTQEAGSP
jgi:hypothetical protein